MIPELGHFALVLALLVTLVLGVAPLFGIWRDDEVFIRAARPLARLQLVLLILAYAGLSYAFVSDDFSVRYVAQHSNTQLPLYYKLSALWSAHEGSLLLWALMLGGWTFAVAELSRSLPRAFVARVLAVMGLIAAGFLLFTLATSNPFVREFPMPAEGRDLNPLLQDPGLTIHPPMIYMGYVGFSVAFAFAVAALMSGQLDEAWARWSRPWTLAAWVFLTLGIGLGSWWAYHELGWGGWWFWDPVENASFMPWLVGTALIHSLAVTEKRDTFKSWTVFLAILAFSLSLLGTFLVRSGVLVSVHAFASDPTRGVFILVFLVVVIGSALTLYVIRAPSIRSGGSFHLLSRESALLVNNVILVASMFAILLATLYPLALDTLGMDKISVGAPYFTAVFVPLMLPVVFLAGLGMRIRWQRDTTARLAEYWPLLSFSAGVALLPLLYVDSLSFAVFIGIYAAVWLALSVGLFVRDSLARSGMPLSALGMSIAHFGLAVFVLGATFNGAYGDEKLTELAENETVELAGYAFRFAGVREAEGPNYLALAGRVEVWRDGAHIASLSPEKRIYRVQTSPMTEAAVDSRFFRDLYVSLGERSEDGRWGLRVYYRPFIQWLWLGTLLIAAGGCVSAFDRRYRKAVR